MTDLTDDEKQALVQVLSLAENHPMWTDPMSKSEQFKQFVDDQYRCIQVVRAFLKRNGILTLWEAQDIKRRLELNAQRIDANQPWRHP